MSTDKRFDVVQFFADIDWVRRRATLNWKQVAAQAGVSASTLTRIAQGHRPDVDGLCALLEWGDLDVSRYIINREATA